ncbi:MAG: fused MFS/spermidine synthase [Gemmatimonadota bacterium]|nr:MAG: fused MFS/spermidine synthase [Gemmatimonadota bacterium]
MRLARSVLLTYFVLGAYAVCAQATLLRETQVVLFGSELSWGLVLACWLTGVAIGAQAGGRFSILARRPAAALVAANLAMPVFLCAVVVLLRGSRPLLGAGPGEYVGLGSLLIVSAAATIPVSVWVGLAFPAASSLLGQRHVAAVERARSVGWVYLTESAGSLVGGALFSFFLVEHLDAFNLVIGGGVLLAAATTHLARQQDLSRGSQVTALTWAVGGAAVIAAGAANRLEHATVAWRWGSFATGLGLVQSVNSRYQNIAVGQLADQLSLYTNGTVAATWPDHTALAIEAHLAACQHPAPRHMLVLGGGAEGLLKELLRHRPERLDYVTLDNRVLDLMIPHLDQPDAAALHDRAVSVHYGDARRFLNRAQRDGASHYELIILAASEPASALEARLYTEQFFTALAETMAGDGVLAFSLSASVGAWGPDVAAYVGSVVAPLERVFPEVLLTFGDPVRIFAAKQPGVLAQSGTTLAMRYRARQVSSPYFAPLWFEGASDLLDPAKLQLVRRALRTQPPRHFNTDEAPAAAVYHMRMWLATTGAAHRGDSAPERRSAGLLSALLHVRLGWVMAALAAATLVAAAAGVGYGRAGLRQMALLWSVGTTGFAGMALEIVLLYTFQVLYGYVYGMVGLVVGIFMFGLVMGSLAMNWHLGQVAGRRSRPGTPGHQASVPGLRAVLILDATMLAFAAALPLVLAALRGSEADLPVQLAVFGLVAAAGLLGGIVFPLAASVWLRDRAGTGRAAAAIDAADHIGGALGALVTGVALVPILGVTSTCLAVAAMKALSTLLVAGGIAAGRSAHSPSVSPA